MTETSASSASGRRFSLKRERWVVCLVLLFSMLTLSHYIHDHWYAMDPRPHPAPQISIATVTPKAPAPVGYAPNVYRIAVPFVAGLVARILPVHWSIVLTLLDIVFGFLGLFTLYAILMDRMSTAEDAWVLRTPVVLAFLAAVALPLQWVVAWQRPETLPSTCYLAFATCCLLRLRRGAPWLFLLLLLTLLQGLTRSDVAVAFGGAILLTSLHPRAVADFGSRKKLLLTGVAVLAVGVATQAYLQLVAFPHAVYPPGVSLIQLPYNFSAHNLNVFLLAVGPSMTALAFGFFRGQCWQGTDVLAMAAALVHLPIWYLVGSTAEVRIFVPFLLLLCIPVARVVASALVGSDGREFAAQQGR